MCLIFNNQEFCNHPECIIYYSKHVENVISNERERMIRPLLLLVISRASALTDLFEIAKSLAQKAEQLEDHKKTIQKEKVEMNNLIKEPNSYIHKIILVGEVPSLVLKEKGFGLTLAVNDMNEQRLFCDKLFKVRLFTNEKPAKQLKLNISSKKIMRGTLENCMDKEGVIFFDNIVINEVSSHYINESFILVISCESSEIRPLIIENLYVRARNSNKK